MNERHPVDLMTHVVTLGDLGLLHTAKVCTKTVVSELCPPFERKRITDIARPRIVVALVRHPLDRLVSTWADCSRPHRIGLIGTHRMTGQPIHGIYAGMPFDEFARIVADHPLTNRHWQPMTVWLRAWGGWPDVLVRYEHLREDWELVRGMQHGIPEFPRAQHNKSERGDWRSYYSDELRERLAGVYAEDMARLGYGLEA